jgi:hypothetical protein
MWDANTSAFAAALAQIVTAIVALAAAVFAWRQVKEARRTREAQAQPFVIVDIQPGRVWANLLMLVVENIGTTLAKDVTVAFDPPLTTTRDNQLTQSVLMRDGISMLPPGRRIETLLDLSHDRLDQKLPMRYEVTVSFHDFRNRPQQPLSYAIDLTYLYNLEQVGEKTMHDLVKEVHELGLEFKEWRDGQQGLLIRKPSDVRRAKNAAAWQSALTGTSPSLAHPNVTPGLGWLAHVGLIRQLGLWWRRRRVTREQGRSSPGKKSSAPARHDGSRTRMVQPAQQGSSEQVTPLTLGHSQPRGSQIPP